MSKFNIAFLALIFCSAAFAKPVTFVCERPAWEGKEGCGNNNTYYTYNLFVETDDFGKEHPVYDFKMGKGCDGPNGAMWTYRYKADDDFIEFLFNEVPTGNVKATFLKTIKLNRKTMKAVLSKVEHSPELTCREEEGPNRRPGTSPAKRGY
jgi:hypothetical protein